MCHTLLRDASFHALLTLIDTEFAEDVRRGGCPHCGGALHRSDYERKPRGSPIINGARRISFCCEEEGCRKRRTPPSVRFLGRRVYLGAMVVLATFLQHGGTERRLLRLQQLLDVSRRTLRRWRLWWQQTFSSSPFWRSARGHFAEPVEEQNLPLGLLLLMGFGQDAGAGLVRLLRFLAPISTRPWLSNPAK